MKLDQVLQVYDAGYAKEYDALYIRNPEMLPSTLYQCRMLQEILAPARSWVDLACGTGFYLSLFERVPMRCGLDISPDMLRTARARNPTIELVQRSFLHANPAWASRWDVISCMWWAYCLVESIHEIETLARNMSEWLTPEGVAYVPLCNPRRFGAEGLALPSGDPTRPGVQLTGLLWSWSEGEGKVHEHMVSPFPETMQQLFSRYFAHVEIVTVSPDVIPQGYWSADFLIARRKRNSVHV